MTLTSARFSARDFIVKFTTSMCVAVVAYLTREVAAQSLLTMLMDFVCHDKTFNQQCMLTQACPQIINHLTSNLQL